MRLSYLTDVYRAVQTGELSERDAVERFMATQRAVTSARARRLDKKLALDLSEAIPPQSALGTAAKYARLRAFYAHQVNA